MDSDRPMKGPFEDGMGIPNGPNGPELERDPELASLVRDLEGLGLSERPSFGPELLGQLEQAWLDETGLPDGTAEPELENDPELAPLLGEMEGLGFSERPSFAPELMGQLERAWLKEAVIPSSRRLWPRVAAVAAAIVVVTLGSVPPARAALQAIIFRGAPANVDSEVRVPSTRFLAVPVLTDSELEVAPELPLVMEDLAPPVVTLDDDEPFIPARVTYPELRDPDAAEALIRTFYPEGLRAAGIGGTTRVGLWVDVDGRASEPRIAESSGVPQLDQAAAAAAPNLRFYPALERGIPRGTWVEFEVKFTASSQTGEDSSLSARPVRLRPMDEPAETDLVVLGDAIVGLPREDGVGGTGSFQSERVAVDGEDLLREAMIRTAPDVDRLGPVRSILQGEAPASVLPLTWRAEAADALEAAIVRSPGNPAPYLALGRIRVKQGLGRDALRLFNLGLARVETSSRAIPPNVVAGLHYERGVLVRDRWAPWAHLGQVSVEAMPRDLCSRAGDPESVGGQASPATVIRWNYLCPAELEQVLDRSFQSRSGSGDVYRTAFVDEFRAAMAANPAHREAATGLILQLGDDGEWDEALDRAQTLAIASGETPEALLLLGLTEHRTGNSERAEDVFERALAGLDETQVRALQDPTLVMSTREIRRLEAATPDERAELEARFWALADPVPGSSANEAWVEHVARGVYAYYRFGGSEEVAELWVRYGRPEGVRAFGAGETRVVLWDLGPGPNLSLRRAAESFDLVLSTEGSAYLEELREVEPRRWPLPISVEALSGQASRFKGATPGSIQVELAVDVSALALSGTESVAFEILQVEEDGAKTSLGRYTQFSLGEVLRTRAEASSSASRVVVELDRGMGNKSVFQANVDGPTWPGATPGVEAFASDLMLVEPVRPTAIGRNPAPQRWSAESVLPLATPVADRGRGLGLYVEFYGVEDQEAELQAVLTAADGSRVVPLLVQPGGIGDTVLTWTASASSQGRLQEYVLADLTNVRPGEYTLVVGLTGEEGQSAWSASHPVVIR